MVYSYFQTREQAELWADSNLTLKVGQRYAISRVFDQQGALYAVLYPLNARMGNPALTGDTKHGYL